MKPFDLEAAKRGEPLKTRSGLEAYFVGMSRYPDNKQPVIIETEDGEAATYGLDGRYFSCGNDSDADLFMATKGPSAWLTVHKTTVGTLAAHAFKSELEAREHSKEASKAGCKVLIAAMQVEL